MPTLKQYEDTFLQVLYDCSLYSNQKLAHALAEAAHELDAQKPLNAKEVAQVNAKVDAIIGNSKANSKGYQNRDKMPEPYLEFSDLYNQLTGQEPTKRVIQDWMMTFSEWQSEGITPEHVRAAYEQSQGKNSFIVVRPGSLTATASAIRAKGKQTTFLRPETQIFKAKEHPEPVYAPMPADAREKMRGLLKSKEMRNG